MIVQKSIARNSFYSLVSTFAQKGLTLFYFILVARTYGPEDQGAYSAALAFGTLFGVLIDLGLSSSLVRETARTPERASVFLGHMFVFRIVLSVIVYALMIISAVGAGYSGELVSLISIAGIAMCIDVFSTSCWAVMRGFQNLLYESIGGVFAIIVMILIGGIAVALHLPVVFLIYAVVAGSASNLLFALYLLVFRARIRLSLQIEWPVARELVILTAPFALAALFSRIYTYSDSALLAKFAGEAHVGYYSAANKLILALNMIPAAVSSSIYPAMSSAFAKGTGNLARTYARASLYLLFLAFPMATGIVLLSEQIVALFYGPSYGPTARALAILSPSLLFGFIMFPLGALLAATNRQKVNTVIFGIAAVLNVLVNLFLIPAFFSSGSAIASTLSSATIFVSSFIATRNQWKTEWSFLVWSCAKILCSTAMMALILLWVRYDVHVVASILIGIGTYAACSLLLRVLPHDDFEKMLNLVRKR